MDEIERVAAKDRLRIAVVADFEGPHARAWLRYFIDRGHDVHAVSFYPPRVAIERATMHALRAARGSGASSGGSARDGRRAGRALPLRIREGLPPGVQRIGNGVRYRVAGLRGVLRRIAPDVVHGHFVVEHGFYAAVAGVRPLVVSAWGSDVLVEPERDLVSRWIARWTVRRADAVTSNNAYMARRIGKLGAVPAKVHVVTLGADRFDLERADASVNRREPDPARAPAIISTRAHERLYNINEIIEAHALLAVRQPDARLRIAHGGSLTEALRSRAAVSGVRAEFTGMLDRAAFRDVLSDAEIFVSVPSSDATSVALLQAMAAGAFPIVADLPSQRELITHGVNGYLAPLHDPYTLARLMERALVDPLLRRTAAEVNRRIVLERGLNETQMAKMEAIYYRVARRTPVQAPEHVT